MKYRIVRSNGRFTVEAQFERSWLSRKLYGEPEWHWIHTYKTLDEAIQARDSLGAPARIPDDWEVVG